MDTVSAVFGDICHGRKHPSESTKRCVRAECTNAQLADGWLFLFSTVALVDGQTGQKKRILLRVVESVPSGTCCDSKRRSPTLKYSCQTDEK